MKLECEAKSGNAILDDANLVIVKNKFNKVVAIIGKIYEDADTEYIYIIRKGDSDFETLLKTLSLESIEITNRNIANKGLLNEEA